MTDHNTPKQSGLSRRELLRRSAIVGGNMVWMAPAVQTLAKPAFASHGTNTANSRTRCYRYQYALSVGPSPGRAFTATPEAYSTSANGCDPTDAGAADDNNKPTVQVSGTTAGTGSNTVVHSVTITIVGVGEGDRSECRFVDTTYISATQSNNTCVSPSSLPSGNKSATVSRTGTGTTDALTKVRFVVCCSPPAVT